MAKIKYKTIGQFGIAIAVTLIFAEMYFGTVRNTIVFLPFYIAALLIGDVIGKILFGNKK
jgi:fucose 4-O-acetylase-like acetyltransferase